MALFKVSLLALWQGQDASDTLPLDSQQAQEIADHLKANPTPSTMLDGMPSTSPSPPARGLEKRHVFMDAETSQQAGLSRALTRAKSAAALETSDPKSEKKDLPESMNTNDKVGDAVPEDDDEEPMKELPMVRREDQQAFKKAKQSVKKSDEASHNEATMPKAKAKPAAKRALKRPAANPASKEKRAKPDIAPPVETCPDTVLESSLEVVEDEPEKDAAPCPRNLHQEFEAAATVTAGQEKPPCRNQRSKEKRKVEDGGEFGNAKEATNMTKKQPAGKGPDEKAEPAKDVGKDSKPRRRNPSGAKSFAGRYCPTQNEAAILRFTLFRKVFEESIKSKVNATSRAEAR